MRRGAVVGRSAGTWVASFLATAAVAPVRIVDRADEGWMLWVMHRVAHGDVLYRDVYDVTTPLPAWLGAAVVRITGTELLGLRLLVAAVIATEVTVACSVVRRVGMQWPGQVVLGVGIVACASPLLVFTSFYTGCAVLGALVALRLLLWSLDEAGRDRRPVAPLVWLGVAVAFSFWSKPNIGALVLAAVVVTLAVAGGRAWRTTARTSAIVVGSFAAVSAVVTVVIAASGAWTAFLDQVVDSKGDYLSVGFSFVTAVERRVDALASGDPIDTRALVWLLVLAAPVVVLAACAWACRRAGRRTDAALVAFVSFAVAGILGTIPRPGVDHLGSALPLMATAAAGAVLSVPERAPGLRVRRGLLITGGTLVAVSAIVVVGAALDPGDLRVTRDAPHFAAVPVERTVARRAVRLRDGLAAHTDGEVFFVRRDAGFLHLLTGTHDPLPYDIAERSDFGADGERGVIRRLRDGEARWVCLQPARIARAGDDPLVPRTLERWVRTHGELTDELPMCDLYRIDGRGSAPSG